MANILVQDDVDIFKLPLVDKEYIGDEGAQITIGDLHGNAMKLIFVLVKHGIVKKITETDYLKLVDIYTTSCFDLEMSDLQLFNNILDKLEFNKDATIRLIGDELADRGSNDYYTLKILEKLHQNKVPVEIILSNHGVEFIMAYETQEDFHAAILGWEHAGSMERLQNLIMKGIISVDEIKSIAEKAYKPTLRALSYTIDKNKSEITIFSHAGIGINNIKAFAKKLNINYSDDTASELALTIEAINVLFQEHVQANTLHKVFNKKEMLKGYNSGGCGLEEDSFEFLTWNRSYKYLERSKEHQNYTIYYAHGHDSESLSQKNIYSLDNFLGKQSMWGDVMRNTGVYTALYSHDFQLNKKFNFKEGAKEIELIEFNLDDLKGSTFLFFPKLDKLDSEIKLEENNINKNLN